MSVISSPILSKQQAKTPTSMRYQKVQTILENDAALSRRIGPKTCPITNRSNEQIMFSRETIEVTNAIHAEGIDAHKVTNKKVLDVAVRLLNILPLGNGSSASPSSFPPVPAQAPAPPPPVTEQFPLPLPEKKQVRTKPQSKVQPKPATKPQVKKRTVAKKAEPIKKPEPVKTIQAAKAPSVKTKPLREDLPEAAPELPPDKKPLTLPPDYDLSKWPHYSVQSSIYSLLLTALASSEHYERLHGVEERQKCLENLVKMYDATCDAVKLKST